MNKSSNLIYINLVWINNKNHLNPKNTLNLKFSIKICKKNEKNKREKIKHKCTINNAYEKKYQFHMFKSIYSFNRILNPKKV